MNLGPRPEQGGFTSTFPGRFASAMDHARGVMAGLQSGLGRAGVADEALARLHEIYRLKVELELETAGVLWRTAEVVCALTDALTALAERDRGPDGGARILQGAEERRRRAGFPPAGPLPGRPRLASAGRPVPRQAPVARSQPAPEAFSYPDRRPARVEFPRAA